LFEGISVPRRARIIVPGLPVHVIQRGVDRSACFFSDEDRTVYLDSLAVLVRSNSVAIHAYVLMTNHVHLLATPSTSDGLSKLMKELGQRYVQYVNRTYARTGTLWEGRFRSCIVETDAYLLACQRYVELNPVRAAMVSEPGDYAWSSFVANTRGQQDPVISPHALYLALGPTVESRCQAYRELFAEVLDQALLDAIRESTNGGFVFGSGRFQKEIAAMLGRRTWKGSPGRPRKKASGDDQHELPL